MAITIIIDNHAIDQRIVFLIGYDDIWQTEQVWDKTHPVAKILVKAGLAEHAPTWSEMTTKHYQLLIKKQLEKYVALDPKDQQDIDHTLVNTLRFLFCAYVRKLSELTGSDVDVIRIQKVGPSDFSMNISLNIVLATGTKEPKKPTPDFKIIVDNTKEE